MNCNICLEELTGRWLWRARGVRCMYCVDGAICSGCVPKYCPRGFSYTKLLNKCKCPVCRQVNWKWIKDEILICMFEDIHNKREWARARRHTDRKDKLYDIVINNCPDYDVEEWRSWRDDG